MEEALTALLLADARVKQLVGDRVHWGRAPQGERAPYLVLQVIGGRPDYHAQGPSGLVDARVQADSYGEKYLATKNLSDAVIALLSGYRGEVAGTRLQAGFVDAARDLPTETDVKRLFRRSADIIIWHSKL
ncbi:DUF3168 domain-containing protein [Ensifer sp. 1H6]|uniref:tail completion protein gp17 n=1 Tax=Ensifer sp. 1H6 TaxID=1911585 RepID=UPI0009CD77D8|nr:DUF3168 domain-containing protein [Ensifer sp. 1H6]OMQ44929.1 hypothetical protein BKP54_11080 [Ensifer sp. 1H6]